MRPDISTIYECLSEMFPQSGHIITSCIRHVKLFEKDTPEDTIVGTLGIDYTGTLYISETFWNTWMTKKSNLKTVLLHELCHPVTNDTRFLLSIDKDDKEREIKRLAANIAQDARLNAWITRFANIKGSDDFFKEFYTPELLQNNPLLGLVTPYGESVIPEPKMLLMYKSLYTRDSEDFFGFYSLYLEVLEYLRKNPPPTDIMVYLIGSHGEDEEENDNKKSLPQEVIDEIRDYIKANVDEKDPKTNKVFSKRPGKSDNLAEVLIAESLGIEQKLNIDYFKKLSFDSIMKNVRLTMLDITNERDKGIIPPTHLSRSDVFKLMMGEVPLFWDIRREREVKTPRKIPIYLDVSGSMYSDLPVVIDLILNVREDIEFVWGFSNKVVLHTMDDLRKRNIKSTGGTDFDCVIKHAIENEFKAILVITDGYAGAGKEQQELSNYFNEVIVVLVGNGRNKENFFSKKFNQTLDLEEVII